MKYFFFINKICLSKCQEKQNLLATSSLTYFYSEIPNPRDLFERGFFDDLNNTDKQYMFFILRIIILKDVQRRAVELFFK